MPVNNGHYPVISQKERDINKEINSESIKEHTKEFLKNKGIIQMIATGVSGIPIEKKLNRKAALAKAKEFTMYKTRGRR